VDVRELAGHRLWNALLKAREFERASVGFEPEESEVEGAWKQFCERFRYDAAAGGGVPAEYVGCEAGDLREWVRRDVRIAQWKRKRFESEVERHYQQRRGALDRVVYSILRVKDAGLATELWFRLREGEATFADLAPRYAAGNEVYTGGVVGPVMYGMIHPMLAGILRSATPRELLRPAVVGEWHLVLRVEHQLPSELDETIRAQMVDELAQMWCDSQIHGNETSR
jgi:hypothetical protein